MYVGAIGLPAIRAKDGTEIAPHLRLRERFELYAGVRPVKAYKGAPRMLLDERANEIDLVIIRRMYRGAFFTPQPCMTEAQKPTRTKQERPCA